MTFEHLIDPSGKLAVRTINSYGFTVVEDEGPGLYHLMEDSDYWTHRYIENHGTERLIVLTEKLIARYRIPL